MENATHNPQQPTELQLFLVQAIKQYVAESPLNRLRDIDGSPIWEEPLVAFADGDDPIFQQFKTAVGELHLTPREVLAAYVGEMPGAIRPEFPRIGVVSWILPIARQTRLSNRRMTEGPSRRWNNTRFQGEEFNESLRRHVVFLLQERGYVAVAPILADFYHVDRSVNVSNWSERHTAFAAGHGTFSLSDGLITSRGIAHRCGSVVVGAAFVPKPRPYSHHMEYCPYPTDGSCGACIQRCPCGAIGPDGHDKKKCRELMFVTQVHWTKKPGYMGAYTGCGLCQTRVPCESGIPPRASSLMRK